MSKYGVFSGPYFPVFSPNTGEYGPEKTPYLDTFNAVLIRSMVIKDTAWRWSNEYFKMFFLKKEKH